MSALYILPDGSLKMVLLLCRPINTLHENNLFHFMNSPSQAELCHKLRQIRDFRCLSQQNMADAMDITQPAYFKIENGKTKLSIQHLEACARFLNVPLRDLISLPFEELVQYTPLQLNKPSLLSAAVSGFELKLKPAF